MTREKTHKVEADFIHLGRSVIRTEAAAAHALLERLDSGFSRACRLLLECSGRVVVIGMGKSGHIAGKFAATLASTGTPAFFVHPGEAGHGDLGMIVSGDVVVALSNSGETEEIIRLIPMIKRLGVPLVAMTGNANSSLACEADVSIDISVEREACPLGLAPTASTTVALIMSDAIAIALLEVRGFSEHDFARSHPVGSLGKRLLLRTADVMHTGDSMPQVRASVLLREALMEMTRKGLGVTAITDADQVLRGIFSEGDVRRALDAGMDFNTTPIAAAMTRDCVYVHADLLAAEALKIMEERRINALPVVDAKHVLIGMLNMHDLLRARIL